MLYRNFSITIACILITANAVAMPPKKLHNDEPSVDSEAFYDASDSPRPQPEAAAADPLVAARELACQPVVIRGFVQAWKATLNGSRNQGLAEAGFAIDTYKSSISIQGWSQAGLNDLMIPTDLDTVAIAHVHGRAADEHPASVDMRSRVPNFVVSRTALYVTVPGARRFVRIRGGINGADAWNTPCKESIEVAQRDRN
jgi:hypothetical protein